MPNHATTPAPANAPAMRAESEVMREMPKVPSKWRGGKVCAIKALRIIMSEGRTRPAKAAMNSTIKGVRASTQANNMKVAANAA
jgi:hypothetical protein